MKKVDFVVFCDKSEVSFDELVEFAKEFFEGQEFKSVENAEFLESDYNKVCGEFEIEDDQYKSVEVVAKHFGVAPSEMQFSYGITPGHLEDFKSLSQEEAKESFEHVKARSVSSSILRSLNMIKRK